MEKIRSFDKDKFFNILISIYISPPTFKISLFHRFKSFFHPLSYYSFFALPTDVYFLLRYLHSYDLSKISRGPEGCRNIKFNKAINSIVYSGEFHNQVYIDYFNVVPKISILHDLYHKCIELPEYFDFFLNKQLKYYIYELHLILYMYIIKTDFF